MRKFYFILSILLTLKMKDCPPSKKDYKKSYDYYLKVLQGRKDDVSAKYGAGISAKNQDIETGKNFN